MLILSRSIAAMVFSTDFLVSAVAAFILIYKATEDASESTRHEAVTLPGSRGQ